MIIFVGVTNLYTLEIKICHASRPLRREYSLSVSVR